MSSLVRFIDAQKPTYRVALAELEAGRKQSHWMWFIFPQLKGLGHSGMAMHYGISDIAEAKSYLADPVLGRAAARMRNNGAQSCPSHRA